MPYGQTEKLSLRRFGMVTMDTDVEELLTLVVSTGKEIDNAAERLQSMSEVVKKGVLQAQVYYSIFYSFFKPWIYGFKMSKIRI